MARGRTPSSNLIALENIDCHSQRPLMSEKGNTKENEQKGRVASYLDVQCHQLSIIQSLLWPMGVSSILSGDRTKWYWTKGHGQNGTDKMVATFIDSNSTEMNFFLFCSQAGRHLVLV